MSGVANPYGTRSTENALIVSVGLAQSYSLGKYGSGKALLNGSECPRIILDIASVWLGIQIGNYWHYTTMPLKQVTP